MITVEDPVEYRLAGINQVQINAKAGLTFAAVLRSILRSDPDIVLIGEIRDHETAQIAVEAALTGHLVLSTLHTNDAPSRGHPAGRDGHRAVPGRLLAGLPCSPSGCAAAVRRGARRPYVPPRPRSWRGVGYPIEPGRAAADAVPPGRLPPLRADRLPRPDRAARGDDGHARRSPG